MHRKLVKSVLILSPLILILSIACGSAVQGVTETPAPPTFTPTRAPTITTYPTYTPKPSPTRVPSKTPEPTATSLNQSQQTDTELAALGNCQPISDKGYVRCMDDTAKIQVDVPDYWIDVNGGPWNYNGKDIGVAISAAPSLSDFHNSLNAEGLFFGASPTYARYVGSTELLDIYTTAYRESCDLIGRYNYDDNVYMGKYDKYANCGGTNGYDAYILAAKEKADPLSKLILIEMQVPPGDLTIRNKIWSTFYLFF